MTIICVKNFLFFNLRSNPGAATIINFYEHFVKCKDIIIVLETLGTIKASQVVVLNEDSVVVTQRKLM